MRPSTKEAFLGFGIGELRGWKVDRVADESGKRSTSEKSLRAFLLGAISASEDWSEQNVLKIWSHEIEGKPAWAHLMLYAVSQGAVLDGYIHTGFDVGRYVYDHLSEGERYGQPDFACGEPTEDRGAIVRYSWRETFVAFERAPSIPGVGDVDQWRMIEGWPDLPCDQPREKDPEMFEGNPGPEEDGMRSCGRCSKHALLSQKEIDGLGNDSYLCPNCTRDLAARVEKYEPGAGVEIGAGNPEERSPDPTPTTSPSEAGIDPDAICRWCGHLGIEHDHRTTKCARCSECKGFETVGEAVGAICSECGDLSGECDHPTLAEKLGLTPEEDPFNKPLAQQPKKESLTCADCFDEHEKKGLIESEKDGLLRCGRCHRLAAMGGQRLVLDCTCMTCGSVFQVPASKRVPDCPDCGASADKGFVQVAPQDAACPDPSGDISPAPPTDGDAGPTPTEESRSSSASGDPRPGLFPPSPPLSDGQSDRGSPSSEGSGNGAVKFFCPVCGSNGVVGRNATVDEVRARGCSTCKERKFYQAWCGQQPPLDLIQILRERGQPRQQGDPALCVLCSAAIGNGEQVVRTPKNAGIVAHDRCLGQAIESRLDHLLPKQEPLRGIFGADPRDPCEYNPTDHRVAQRGDEWHSEAQVMKGTGARTRRLCFDCASLPEFSRLRKEVLIDR